MLIKKDVTNKEAFEYLRQQLISGKTLSNFTGQLNIEAGKVFAFVPENASEEQILNYHEGGLSYSEKELINDAWLSRIINIAGPHIKGFIENYLTINTKNCCLFEECNAEPHDASIVKSKIEFVHIENEMYYFFNKENFIKEKFEEAFHGSGGWYFLCILSSLNLHDHRSFSPFNEITPNLLKTIANNAVSFIVSAYDHEGYLIWEKQ